MSEYTIYKDIASRTGGDIYVGVVGPVRSGKSTFIKRFMESLVLPNIGDGYDRDRARDSVPQSAGGKTVMTTEPKFIPDEAVNVSLDGASGLRVRLIDCVGYVVDGALGTVENGEARMVRTPWQEEPMPFVKAAEMGTHKVISEHSTIGMVITTDGTIGEIARESYVPAEERVVEELKAMGKPFAVVLNSARPGSSEAMTLAYELEEKYKVPVALVSCLDLDAEDIRRILEMVLHEFPVSEVTVRLPAWVSALDPSHKIRASITGAVRKCAEKVKKTGDVRLAFSELSDNEFIERSDVARVDLGTGKAELSVKLYDGLYYSVISEQTGFHVENDEDLFTLLRRLAEMKAEYDKISEALRDASEKGYGIVMPAVEDLHLEEPEIVKQPGGYGVRLRAAAQSIHMIRANIEAEVHPIVGTEQQSEDLIRYMLREFEEDPTRIWASNLFGKTLYELVNESLHAKLEHIPEESREKLAHTLERIVNEGSGGLICILL
ncbi:MAG: stage IV sporulation protein A [Clostridia bacterium]|nr:stage IV sporulation protein A [Clostridia bacterium]